jgi:hypothetical protein
VFRKVIFNVSSFYSNISSLFWSLSTNYLLPRFNWYYCLLQEISPYTPFPHLFVIFILKNWLLQLYAKFIFVICWKCTFFWLNWCTCWVFRKVIFNVSSFYSNISSLFWSLSTNYLLPRFNILIHFLKQTKQKKKQQKNQQKTQQQQNKSIHSCKLQCVLKPNIVIKYTFYSWSAMSWHKNNALS